MARAAASGILLVLVTTGYDHALQIRLSARPARATTQSPSTPPVPTPAEAQRLRVREQPFVIANLGWDDALVPIARFSGRTWVNTWPEPDDASVPVPLLAEIPDAWLGRPVPRFWRLWQQGTSRVVSVVGARRGERDTRAGCTSPAVLDLAKPAGAGSRFFGERGVAIDTGQPVGAFREVDRTGQEWSGMEIGFMNAVRAAEARAMARSDHRWVDEAFAKATLPLADLPLTVEVLRPVVAEGESIPVYFFTASRQGPTPRGMAGFKVFGWMRRTGTAWTSESVNESSISEEGQSSLSPMARIRYGRREFWLMGVGGIESGGFAIFEITDRGVTKLLDADNGGC